MSTAIPMRRPNTATSSADMASSSTTSIRFCAFLRVRCVRPHRRHDGGDELAIAERFPEKPRQQLRRGVHHRLLRHAGHQEDAVEQIGLLHVDEIQHAESIQSAMNDEIEDDRGVLMRAQLLDGGVALFHEVDDESFALQRDPQDQLGGAVVFDDEYPILFHYGRKYMLRSLPGNRFRSSARILRGRGETMFTADALLNAISQAVLATDGGGTIVFSNPAADELFGGGALAASAEPLAEVMPDHDVSELFAGGARKRDRGPADAAAATTTASRSSPHARFAARTAKSDGFVIVSTPLDGLDLPRVVDESERLRLENRLLQAERISSLGRLAASVAHEFNNVLMGIQPFIDLLTNRAGSDPAVKLAAPRIADAVARGKRITQEILRFTRIGEPTRVPVNVAEWLHAFEPGAGPTGRPAGNGDRRRPIRR